LKSFPIPHPRTCFVGTTVSEYALLPQAITPEQFVSELLATVAPSFPFLIIKDIPIEGTLVGEEALGYARRLTDECKKMGFVLLEGQSLAYVPIDFTSVDEFLSRRSHTRRRNLRRKLKSRASLTIESITSGDARVHDEMFLAELYALYLNVYRQSEIHFDLLTASFFRAVLQDADTNSVIFAYRLDGNLIGYNLCVCENGVLLDKYIGFVYPQARDHNIYAVSWFHNLEYALANGLRYYVAGWTDPEVKRELGATFTLTQQAVYVRNPVLRTLLRLFRRLFETGYR
jgi:predicted N-acyltransferase